MYCEELGFSLPDDVILEIRFLKYGDFRDFAVNGTKYTIIAEDNVGNLIGVDPGGKVWFLDTEKKVKMYASKDLQTFVTQMELYGSTAPLPPNASEEQLEADTRQFARKITKLDNDALLSENSFWSLITEQMRDGLL